MGISELLPEPLAITLKVTHVLEELSIPYLIGGSLASTLYGMVRTTQDSDIVAEMLPEHVNKFITLLTDEFYVDEQMISEAVRTRTSFNFIHRDTMFKVDIFIPERTPFLISQLSRANTQILSNQPRMSAKFASAEDTILSKLEWYRLGGEISERQWRDVLGILRTRMGQLDLAYLEEWSDTLKVKDLLKKALEQSE